MVKGEVTVCTRCLTELPKTSYHLRSDNPIKTDCSVGYLRYGWTLSPVFERVALYNTSCINSNTTTVLKLAFAWGWLMDMRLLKPEPCPFDVIVPVPLHATRQRQRGYNQAAKFAEGLKRGIINTLG